MKFITRMSIATLALASYGISVAEAPAGYYSSLNGKSEGGLKPE